MGPRLREVVPATRCGITQPRVCLFDDPGPVVIPIWPIFAIKVVLGAQNINDLRWQHPKFSPPPLSLSLSLSLSFAC